MTTHVIAPIDLPAFLAPTIAAALDEAESQAEIPQQLHSQLRDAGAFRLLTPREYGGSETPPVKPGSTCVTDAEGSVIGELLKAVLCRR
jgi:alkylation response protein AidB-like acyl-CoA dehydrogenase